MCGKVKEVNGGRGKEDTVTIGYGSEGHEV